MISPVLPMAIRDVASVSRPAIHGSILGMRFAQLSSMIFRQIDWKALAMSMLIMLMLVVSLFSMEKMTLCMYSAPPSAPSPNWILPMALFNSSLKILATTAEYTLLRADPMAMGLHPLPFFF